MMHVMQPVVLDTGWPTTHSSAASPSTPSSCVTADVTAVDRTVASAGLGGGLTANGMAGMLQDSRPQSVSAGTSFNTLNHVDVMCHDQSVPADSRTNSTASQPAVDSPLKPPKKPLTPYMRFSKAVWSEVKQANSGRSVCEIGSVIGRMWRELGDVDKRPYFESFTDAKAEYDRELKAYLDVNGLKPSDLVKPKVRKKETKKQQSQVAGEIQQLTADSQQRHHLPWPVSAAAAAHLPDNFQASRPSGGHGDDLLVYHVRADGTQECYVQRADGGMKAAAGGAGAGQLAEREVLVSTLAEQTHNVTQLRLQLLNARGRVAELEQQNDVLRQLLRDAQLPKPAR